MDIKEKTMQLLIYKKKPLSISDIAYYLNIDMELAKKIVNELSDDFRIKLVHNKYTFTDYKNGKLVMAKKGNGYITCDGNRIWIDSSKLNGANNGDNVLVDIIDSNADYYEGIVISTIKNKKENKVGTIVDIDGDLLIKPDNDNCYIKATDSYVIGEKVVYTKGKLIRNNIYAGSIVKEIGHIDDPRIDVYTVLAKNNVNIDFSDKVKLEVSNIPHEVVESDLKGRLDLRDKMIFTIDGDDSKDFDDAVSLNILDNGNYELGVHIADVSYYVKDNSSIDIEARNRGTSVYLPGMSIPMLPRELSNGICSLNPNVDRLTMSVIMEISKDGKMVNYKIEPSVINSNKRMTYNEVNEVLKGNPKDDYKKYEDNLLLMNKLKDILRKRRIHNGSIEFDTDDIKIIVDNDGKPIDIYKYYKGEAENLIEEFMLSANIVVAVYLEYTNLPSIYRIHDHPDPIKVSEFIDTLSSIGISVPKQMEYQNAAINNIINVIKELPNRDIYNKMLIKTMSKAIYSTENTGHFALNFPCYTHFTSPIRRYTDLSVHRLIRTYDSFDINDSNRMYNYLKETAYIASSRERNSIKCETTVNGMYMANYISDKVGETFTGIITGINENSLDIELYNGITGMVFGGNIYKNGFKTPYKFYHLGDSMDVELLSVNKDKGEINFKEKVLIK